VNLTIRIEGMDAAKGRVRNLAGQINYAASVAINASLRTALAAERQRMQTVFDAPVPYIVRNAAALTLSKKDALAGTIALNTSQATGDGLPAGKPLLAEVTGGARRLKRSEVLLQSAGVLPRGWFTVPARGVQRDPYGNLPRSLLLQILAWFQAYPQTARSGKAMRSNTSDKGKARLAAGSRNRAGISYFAVQPGAKSGGGKLKPGIYQRQQANTRFQGAVRTRAVLVFVPRVAYKQRLDFVEQAHKAVSKAFESEFSAALTRALATARPA
jgi:hypothetical protein